MIDNFKMVKRVLEFDNKDSPYIVEILWDKEVKYKYFYSHEDFVRSKESIKDFCRRNKAEAYCYANPRPPRYIACNMIHKLTDMLKNDNYKDLHNIYDISVKSSSKSDGKIEAIKIPFNDEDYIQKMLNIVNQSESSSWYDYTPQVVRDDKVTRIFCKINVLRNSKINIDDSRVSIELNSKFLLYKPF